MAKESINYTDALHVLCVDVCRKLKEFRNVDTERIGYSFASARNTGSRYGVWASMTPLRFENGRLVTVKERRVLSTSVFGNRIPVVERRYFKCPQVCGPHGEDLLYIFNIMAPRFFNLSPLEKIDTIMHELYHISPLFNGDVRRFPGRNWQHGDKKTYEAKAASLRKEWLATDPDPRIYDFLQYDQKTLYEKFSRITGNKFSKIPLVNISEEEAFRLEPSLALQKR